MLKDTLWNSELNKLIGPLEIEGLYGIFKVIGKKESKPIEFSLIKNQVIDMLRMDYQRIIINKRIQEISKNINVKINDNAIKNLSILG
jgi:parvulin-like peptidyl-prolyl isomerase